MHGFAARPGLQSQTGLDEAPAAVGSSAEAAKARAAQKGTRTGRTAGDPTSLSASTRQALCRLTREADELSLRRSRYRPLYANRAHSAASRGRARTGACAVAVGAAGRGRARRDHAHRRRRARARLARRPRGRRLGAAQPGADRLPRARGSDRRAPGAPQRPAPHRRAARRARRRRPLPRAAAHRPRGGRRGPRREPDHPDPQAGARHSALLRAPQRRPDRPARGRAGTRRRR